MSTTRDNGKPNTAALHRGRVTFLLAGIADRCAYCTLPVSWSRAKADVKRPGWATFGHVVPECKGGGWQGNVVPECWTCQTDGKIVDKSGDAAYAVPARWVSAKVASDFERGNVGPMGNTRSLPGANARRAARMARGLKW